MSRSGYNDVASRPLNLDDFANVDRHCDSLPGRYAVGRPGDSVEASRSLRRLTRLGCRWDTHGMTRGVTEAGLTRAQ